MAILRRQSPDLAMMAPVKDRYWLHILLFVVTLLSTAYTGATVFIGRAEAWNESHLLLGILSAGFVRDGLVFALSLLGFLTVHEFGHYVAARRHGVRTTLPYYIPSPLIGIGTLGAVIRIREQVPTGRKLFDIGAAGPVAGFVVALGILVYALATLPAPEYMFGVPGHEPLLQHIARTGDFPASPLPGPEGFRMTVGSTPLYWALSQLFPNVPPMYEMYHYPMLFAAWLGLFFTALNLLPVGQLDGGHILYAMVGRVWHGRLARGFMLLMLCSTAIRIGEGGAAVVSDYLPFLADAPLVSEFVLWGFIGGLMAMLLRRMYSGAPKLVLLATAGIVLIAALARAAGPQVTQFGYAGWLLWCFLLVFFIKVDHPPVLYVEPLTRGRMILGIASFVIFVLCFSIKPLYFA